MAWSESLLDCSFRGFVFDVLKTEDSAERSTAEHAYPYLDGSDIEDLGRGARHVSVEAIFWEGLASQGGGNSAKVSGYESSLRDFLKVLDQAGAGELIHPVFGSMLVQVHRYQVRHEAEGVDQCSVHVEFIETSGSDKPFFERSLASQKVDLISYRSGIARTALGSALANLIDTLRNSSPLAALNSLRQEMLGPILATMSDVQGVLLSGLDVLNYPRAWVNDISSIVDGVLDLKDFGTNLIADWKSVGNVLSLFDVFSSSGSSAPTQIRAGATPSEAQAVAATQAHLAASTAIGMANAAGLVLAAEADPQHGPTLSPPEIDSVVDDARTRIEAAIAAIRAIYPLETARTITEPMKDQALALQEAARAIIEARPPLIQKTVEAPGNLRLVAHQWYGDHTRAPELARLNPSLRLPNNLQFGDVLNAYAV
jgi:prophage DNA circulation protein